MSTTTEHATEELLGALEGMVRRHCNAASKYDPKCPSRVDSGAIPAHADALEVLAKHGRFRIAHGVGCMLVGYWPDSDPKAPNTGNQR